MRKLHVVGYVSYVLIVAGAMAAAAEAMVYLAVWHGSFGPLWERTVRAFYTTRVRSIVQSEPECTVYDAELGYRLRPGHCTFQNREYRTTLDINSLGLRDDETSSNRPEIIVLGDSFAMGWGLAQDETIPALLEKATSKRTLNAAISSYGTVREMRLLSKLDRSQVEWIIIQYCPNDSDENIQAVESPTGFIVSSEQQFQNSWALHRAATRYNPFKYIREAIPLYFKIRSREPVAGDPAGPPWVFGDRSRELGLFATVLDRNRELFGRARVLVFELESWNRNDPSFAQKLNASLARFPELKETVVAVEVASHLSDESYYRIDDHLRADGARVVAGELLNAMRRESR